LSPDSAAPRGDERSGTADLFELRPGLYLNPLQFVSVRVLPSENEGIFAVLQLSSGDKLDLTRKEFAAITGTRLPSPTSPINQEIRGSTAPAYGSTKKSS
jgi:hypothetical protein